MYTLSMHNNESISSQVGAEAQESLYLMDELWANDGFREEEVITLSV